MKNYQLQFQKRLTKTWFFMLLSAMLIVLSACGGAATGTNTNEPATNETSSPIEGGTQQEAAETVYPLTLKDATGTEVTFEKAPERVVTLVPSETEIMFAVGAGGEVVGVDKWSNYPEEAADKPKVGDMSTNIEAVMALNPDLVVASATMNGEAVTKLRELNVTVFASSPKTLDETIAHIEQIGVIMNKQAKAGENTARMREVKERVTTAVKDAPKKKVYLEFSPGYSVGKGEFLDELLTLAGGVNIAGDQTGWFQIDPEKVLQSNPEIVIYPDFGDDDSILKLIQTRPGWDQIDAVKNNQLFKVANDPLVRVGPRLTDGLLEIAKAIHPDLVK